MSTQKSLTPVEYLNQHCAGAAEAFQNLRKSVQSCGPLDAHTCELIALGAFVATGMEASFKVHAKRLLQEKVDPNALRQAVLVTFGASATFSAVVAGLHWIDDLLAPQG